MDLVVENILRETIRSLGYEKVSQILETYKPVEPVVAVAPVVEKPSPVVAPSPKAEAKKNIGRMSSIMTETLKKQIGAEFNEKLHKKQFMEYVNALDSKTYSLKKPEVHISDYVATLKKEEKKVSEVVTKDVSLKELQTIKTLTTPQGIKPGVFWETTQGIFVRGPSKDPDEYCVEKTFNGKKYMVGENSGRIYTSIDEDDESFEGSFVGFVGVGEFQ